MIKIKTVTFKNLKSFGKVPTEFNFDNIGITRISGMNGCGKCLSEDTIIDVSINNPNIEKLLWEYLINENNN